MMCGLSELRWKQRMRSVLPAVKPAFLRRLTAPGASPQRVVASTACLLVLALAVAGCAALGAALRTGGALQTAGYQNVNVNVATGSGLPAGGLVSVSYSRGPAGSDQRDAQGAEKIVWDNFPGRFGAVAIIKVSGGCAGPVCATHSNELASATYAQLAATLGPRPPGLDKASAAGHIAVPDWALFLGLGLAVAIIAAAAIVLTLLLRRNKSSEPGPQPWQAGRPSWPPGPPAPPAPPGPPGGWPTGSSP